MRYARNLSLGLLALLFITAGTLHFAKAPFFVRIVPPGLPDPPLLVGVSGICEMLGGIGLLIPAVRRYAGFGLLALLVAVFPANLYMALNPRAFADLATPAMLWWRLPLQPLLMAWVYAAACTKE